MEWTIRAAETLWAGMLVHLWQSTWVLLLLLVLSPALRNAPARLLAGLWWIGVLKLLLPLSLIGPLTAGSLRPLMGSVGEQSSAAQNAWVTVTVWLYPQTLRAPVEPSSSTMGVLYLALTLAWFCGLGWILVRRIRRSTCQVNAPVRTNGARRDRLESKLGQALALTPVTREAIRLVEGSGVPSVRGLLQPSIELPARVAEALEVRELSAVLLHEEEHRLRRDPLRSAPAALASWLFFFYPPLRWVLRRIHETTEMACDEAVLRYGIAPESYARAIARTLELGLEPSPNRSGLVGPCRSAIRRRLARLTTHRRVRTMPRHRLILATAVAIALVGSVAPLTPGTPGRDDAERSVALASSERFEALDRLRDVDQQVTLNFDRAQLDSVLNAVSAVASFEVELHSSVGVQPVTIVLENVSLREALIKLAKLAGLSYEVPDPTTLRVRAKQVFLPGEDGITSPQRIEASAVAPVYPEQARQDRVTGRVILQAIIDEAGRVSQVEVLSTNQPDYPAFVDSAVEALEQWRYLPATRDGEPVSVYFTVVVEFALDKHKRKTEPEAKLL